MKTTLPFGPWLPDLPAYLNPGTAHVKNVVPRGKGKGWMTYGPMYALSADVSALPARAQGAFAALDDAGNVILFAGTTAALYKLESGESAWTDVSQAGGYTTATDGFWRFTQFGDMVIAVNGIDPPQKYVIGTSTDFEDLGGNPPVAREVAVVREFVVLGNLTGTSARSVRWSAANNAEDWTASQTTQSDSQELAGEGGAVQAIVGGNYGLIILNRSIVRMIYVGPPLIFTFDEVVKNIGTKAPGSVANQGPSAVWFLSDDGFRFWNGEAAIPIGHNKVDRTFYEQVDQQFASRISSAVDPINKIVMWPAPSTGNSGNNDRLWLYAYAVGEWAIAHTALEIVATLLTPPYTLEELDPFGDLETLPFSLDSQAWMGGKLIAAGVNGSHEFGFFSGDTMEAEVDTTERELSPGRHAYVRGARPLADGGEPSIAMGTRARTIDDVTYGTASAINANGDCPQDVEARLHRARLTMAAGGSWSHIQGVMLDFAPAGEL